MASLQSKKDAQKRYRTIKSVFSKFGESGFSIGNISDEIDIIISNKKARYGVKYTQKDIEMIKENVQEKINISTVAIFRENYTEIIGKQPKYLTDYIKTEKEKFSEIKYLTYDKGSPGWLAKESTRGYYEVYSNQEGIGFSMIYTVENNTGSDDFASSSGSDISDFEASIRQNTSISDSSVFFDYFAGYIQFAQTRIFVSATVSFYK